MMIFQRFSLGSKPAGSPAETTNEIKSKEPPESDKTVHADSSSPPPVSTGDAVVNLSVEMENLTLPEVLPLASPPPKSSNEEGQTPESPGSRARRFSFRPFAFGHDRQGHKHALSTDQDHHKKARAADAYAKRTPKPVVTSSTKRAKESALILRALIVGPSADALSPQITRATAAPQLSKVKSQLMRPTSANKVIAELRSLPVTNEAVGEEEERGPEPVAKPRGPIHAVCLAYTESEAHERHFNQLAEKKATTTDEQQSSIETAGFPSVSSAKIDKVATMLNDMHVVSLMEPDMGLGQPGDGKGILAGALPTPETVINGIVRITPQLMALGYTSGISVFPDHQGIYPPTDRISVITYWWGLELLLPPPTLAYLNNVHSMSTAVINCLTALSVVHNGVREILPFVRYIGQYVNFEFDSIMNQNKGQGVVCAATWIMPAAMVPRPWDFAASPSATQVNEVVLMTTGQGKGQPPPSSPTVVPEVIVTPPTATLDKRQLPTRTLIPA